MSCNNCRVLRKNCGDTCVLRPCLQSISPEKQANAVVVLSNFFGPNFIALISAVPEAERTVVFRTLLLEACGRMVNPVEGVVGLLGRGQWDVCQKAVETVLVGRTVTPIPYTPCQPPALTLSLGHITTNPSSGSSSEDEEKKTLDLFK